MNLTNPLHWIAFYRILEQTHYCCKANWMHMKHLIISEMEANPVLRKLIILSKRSTLKLHVIWNSWNLSYFPPETSQSVCSAAGLKHCSHLQKQNIIYCFYQHFSELLPFSFFFFLKLNTSLNIWSLYVILYWKYFRSQFGLFGFLILSLEYNLKWKVCPSDGLTLTGELLQSWNLFSHLGGW